MGSPESEPQRRGDEGPQHRVRITRAFYLGKYTVTQAQYEQIVGKNPSWFSPGGRCKNRVSGIDTSRFPVEYVSWHDAVEFCRRLSAKDGHEYRLPTEAEWEYACRAGSVTAFHFGNSLNGRQANCQGEHPYGTEEKGPKLWRTTTVGSYPPNEFGLCDMHGNVWQWCADWFDAGYYMGSPADDPKGPNSGERRVLRGGSWDCWPAGVRAAFRLKFAPSTRDFSVGFRVARTPQ
jgi:formylglycine-generating enzyme required for sulfatase activity